MTTANKITIFRVILIPVFLVLMYLRFPGHTYWAFGVFVLASLSDFADGYIARHYNQVSDFGKFMDPLADKLLVMAAMLLFVEQHQMPAWALLLRGRARVCRDRPAADRRPITAARSSPLPGPARSRPPRPWWPSA